jgi:hypothetical protein
MLCVVIWKEKLKDATPKLDANWWCIAFSERACLRLWSPESVAPQPLSLNQIEEFVVLQEVLKLGDAIASELFVLEIDRVSGSLFAVQDIKRL